MKIIQVLTTVSFGDAVSNDCLALYKLLRSSGYQTSIYAEHIDPKIKSVPIKNVAFFPKISDDDIIIYHLSTGTDLNQRVKTFGGRKFIIYHNITPASFFTPYSGAAARLCDKGREEIISLKDTFEAGFCDSDYNRRELVSMGYTCPLEVRPVLIPFSDYEKKPDGVTLHKYQQDGVRNILFVGRIAPNKKQENLISMLYAYKKMYKEPVRLILAGSDHGMERYSSRLKNYVYALGLEKDVVFTGQTSFASILAYYRLADAFVCMSEHEGFCVPLTEAMSFDVPIIALNSCATPETMGDSGLVLESSDPAIAASYLNLVLTDEDLRKEIVAGQRTRLNDFSYKNVSNQFITLLQKFIKGDKS